jgi:hypothetical protein
MVIAEAFQLFGAGSIFASGKSSIKSSIPDQTQMWRVAFLVAGTCRKADMSEAPAGLRFRIARGRCSQTKSLA